VASPREERRPPLLAELRSTIFALGQLNPDTPLHGAHLELILTAITRRLDDLELRLDALDLHRDLRDWTGQEPQP
jgi:hypothetical protein